jgi:hypothetical protein
LQNEQQGRRINRLLIIAFGMILLIVALIFIRIYVNTLFSGSNNLTSQDWAGYSVASDFTNPQPVIAGINGSWTVPTISVSQGNVFSAVWIGIGGLFEPSDGTLIQTGTEQDSTYGNVTYSAWYELLPNNAVTIATINVSPEDEITASINLLNSTTNNWSIEIVDLTNTQSFQTDVFYNSSRLSAEWIVERPTAGRNLGTLADFGNVTFTNSKVAMNSSVGTISDFPFIQVIMQNRHNVQLVNVSSLSSDGSSFTVSYLGTDGTAQSMLNEALVVVAARKVVLPRVLLNEMSC